MHSSSLRLPIQLGDHSKSSFAVPVRQFTGTAQLREKLGALQMGTGADGLGEWFSLPPMKVTDQFHLAAITVSSEFLSDGEFKKRREMGELLPQCKSVTPRIVRTRMEPSTQSGIAQEQLAPPHLSNGRPGSDSQPPRSSSGIKTRVESGPN
ncbi:hypothetical protein B0H17DRAFT_1140955 [Mycena rosella]|uniref:Uncharacterized protein n=1 Tax=Mycena rosella TaxID=1033263 RepID=A0AAD7D0L9_MYCRO|nr:hypothetical protein B0H17DRAFT_1140955 [Mycena rosella]